MMKSQRKEATDPRLNPDKMPGKRGEFAEECGEWREEAVYLLEHSQRGEGGAAKVFHGSKVSRLRKSANTEKA